MDNNLITPEFERKLRDGCKEAVRNINKNLTRWCEAKKFCSKIEVSITDLNGLVKNWMMRCLKDKIGTGPTHNIFKRGTFFIHLTPEGNVQSISLNSLDHWSKNIYHTKLGEVLSSLYYPDLYYNENEKDYSPLQEPGFEPTFYLDLSPIRNFSFNK